MWEVNERGSDGGYTKVKCEFKFVDQERIINRIDITNRVNNGDFNPSQEHIVTYLQSIADEGEIEPITPVLQLSATANFFSNGNLTLFANAN